MADKQDKRSNLLELLRRQPRTSAFSHSEPGLPPGTIHDEPEAPPTVLRVLAYGADDFEEAVIDEPEEIVPFIERWDVVWLDVEGVGDADVLTSIGEGFGFPNLALEDVQNQEHRPKVEFYDERVHIILKMARWDDGLTLEQVSLLAGPGFVVTFRTANLSTDYFESVRKRIIESRRIIRQNGADYLTYAIVDRIIDAGFPLLEHFAEAYNDLEANVVEQAGPDMLTRIHALNSQLLVLRRAIWPHRDIVQTLRNRPDSFFSKDTEPFLKDCLDHTVQISEMADNYHALGTQLLNFYLSLSSHRQTEITKVLTIIATIFIPLTFVAGIYGMNFDPEASPWNMPELNWYWGYPVTLLGMLLIGLGLVYYFYRKGWVGR